MPATSRLDTWSPRDGVACISGPPFRQRVTTLFDTLQRRGMAPREAMAQVRTVLRLLDTVHEHGIELFCDSDTLRYQARKGAVTAALRAQIDASKPALLALLQDPPAIPQAHVGRDGAPCPQCGKRWQWPTTTKTWVCATCFVLVPQTAPRFAADGRALPPPHRCAS